MASGDSHQDASRRRRYSEVEARKMWYATCRTVRFARRQGFLTQSEAEIKLLEFMVRIMGQ